MTTTLTLRDQCADINNRWLSN